MLIKTQIKSTATRYKLTIYIFTSDFLILDYNLLPLFNSLLSTISNCLQSLLMTQLLFRKIQNYYVEYSFLLIRVEVCKLA